MEPGDQQLVERMLAGDAGALEELYRRHQAGIYRFALHMCGSASLAEDVTHDVFLHLMRRPRSYDPGRGSVAAFLLGVARNFARRRSGRRAAQPDVELAAPGEGPLEAIGRGELIESVRAAVLALPLHYREVVVLCELEEREYSEAAAVLGCAVGTVRSRLNRARALLAEKLREAHGPVVEQAPARCSV